MSSEDEIAEDEIAEDEGTEDSPPPTHPASVRWVLERWWATLFLVLSLPLAVVVISRWTLNEIIPCNLLDFDEIKEATNALADLSTMLSGSFALGLYRFGLSVVAVFAAAFALLVVSFSILAKSTQNRANGSGLSVLKRIALPSLTLLVLLGFAFMWFDLDQLENWRPKTCVARTLIDLTLNQYNDSVLPNESSQFRKIGNLASSVEDLLSWAMIALVASLLIAAVATVANSSPKLVGDLQRRRRDHLVLAAVALLIATYFTGHTYLELGGIPLQEHLALINEEIVPGDLRLFTLAVADYEGYQAAQELAWALISSLTLAVIYLPTLLFSLDEDDSDPATMAQFAIKGLTIISPWLTVQGLDLIGSLTETLP